jgi:hypothetical protein
MCCITTLLLLLLCTHRLTGCRAIFPKSTMKVWPWSYDSCDEQQVPGLRWKQQVSACDAAPGHGLNPRQGRGSPEVDLFEVMLGHTMPLSQSKGENQGAEEGAGAAVRHIPAFMSSSLQVAPGIPPPGRPVNGVPLNSSARWYDGLLKGPSSELNYGFWGQLCGPEVDQWPDQRQKYLQDAISVNTELQETHFRRQHLYRRVESSRSVPVSQ